MTTGGTNCTTYTVHLHSEEERRDTNTLSITQCAFTQMQNRATLNAAFAPAIIRPQPPHSAAHHQSSMTTTDDAETLLKNRGNLILVNFEAIKVSSRESGLLVSNCSNVRTSPPSNCGLYSSPHPILPREPNLGQEYRE